MIEAHTVDGEHSRSRDVSYPMIFAVALRKAVRPSKGESLAADAARGRV